MNDYYKVVFNFSPWNETESDILSALLADAGFESFEQEPPALNAYIKAELLAQTELNDILFQYPFSSTIDWKSEFIVGEDWNKEWEKNYFTPMLIGDRCVIHSSFHKDYPKAEYEIVIDPKMAFGTGHHETTSLMVERLLDADLSGKTVMDMGTGTGILAMLSVIKGAKSVSGVEIDQAAYENALENVKVNNVDVHLYRGDASVLKSIVEKFDLLLANINRNIILNDMEAYAASIVPGGEMQISGFYSEDVPMLVDKAASLGLELKGRAEKKNWTMLLFKKEQ